MDILQLSGMTEVFRIIKFLGENKLKKISLICSTVLIGLALTACGNSSSQKSTNSSNSSSKTTKVVKHHKVKKTTKKIQKTNSSQQSNSESANTQNTVSQQNSQSGNVQQGTQSNVTKSQSEINRERGYDPNGAPLLPGQDHAAGSNPDGSPDAWVQGQIDWAIQNGYMNPDGTNTPKGQAAEDEVERDSQPGMP